MRICRSFAVLTLILLSICAFAQSSDQAQQPAQSQSAEQTQQAAPAQSSDQARQSQDSTQPQQPEQAPSAQPSQESDQAPSPEQTPNPDQTQKSEQPQSAGQPQTSEQTPNPDQLPTSEQTEKPEPTQTPEQTQSLDFDWNWHAQEVIGRTDISLGNTSKLTEPERSELLDAVVLRLQKPMAAAGYDDGRIREIASTTRLRFVDTDNGKPVLFATSLGMEGGCDSMGNCPFWIFRRSDDGYVSMLDTTAASYTIQPAGSDGFSDLVMMSHVTSTESALTLYRAQDGKYVEAGCYTALFPPPTADPSKVTDPAIKPCKTAADEPQPEVPEVKQEPAPPGSDAKQPPPEQK